MKNKNIIIGLVAVVIVIGIILIARPFISKKQAKKVPVKVGMKYPVAGLKKSISKDKGALTVKVVDSKKKEVSLRIRAFKSINAKSSVYQAVFITNRMQELSPGTYDIEVDTIPQTIYKNVKVAKGRETIEDIGYITGSINVKALNAQKKDVSYPVRILYSKSNEVAAVAITNRPLEILPGIYDIEVATVPKQMKKDVKVELGRENLIDLGCTVGTLTIKAIDENNKAVRYGVRIAKPENNEPVATAIANRPIEILQGLYNIEIASTPKQEKKEIKVTAGEETVVEFSVKTPPAPPVRVPPKAGKK